jgi:N-acetylglucosaminyl-diphospho-decaprenol L-rhamnosyltransferase
MKLFQNLTIQIVLYEENREMVFKCLDKFKNFKIIILDNSGNYKLKEEILKNFNISKYLLENKNLGYSKGHNKAASYVETDYLLILNADCLIDEVNVLQLFNAYQRYNNVGIVAPTTYDEKHQLTYNGDLLPENGSKDIVANISGDTCFQSVLGSAMLIKKKDFIEVGMFNENLFLFFSDFDLCRKFSKLGKSIIQIHSAKAYHSHGISKVKNIFKRIFLKEFNMTFDELIYFSEVNEINIRFIRLKKKIFNYYFKCILNIFLLNFKKVTFYFARILAFYKYKMSR